MISSIAKFYGFNPIKTGTKKQRDYAESIRENILKSKKISEKEKIKIASMDSGFIVGYKFWIKNKNINPSLFTYHNILGQYRAIEDLKEKYSEILARTGNAIDKNKARIEIDKKKSEAVFDYD